MGLDKGTRGPYHEAMRARELFPFWDDVHDDLVRCLDFADGLGFRPTPPQMTIAEQFRHVITVEEYWQNVLERKTPLYHEYTEAELPGKAEIAAKLEAMHARTGALLDSWDAEAVAKTTFRMRDGAVSAHWILNHCYEHAIHHKGQLMVYFRLMGKDPGGRFMP